MKYIAIILGFFSITFIVLSIVSAVSNAKIDSYLRRAKDAGNPAQVAEFLTNYKTELYVSNKVNGKFYTIFQYSGSYMPTYIKAIDGLIVRAEALATQSPTDTSYQMGLINLEKDLGDTRSVAFLVWGASGIGLLITQGAWILSVLLGVLGIISMIKSVPIYFE